MGKHFQIKVMAGFLALTLLSFTFISLSYNEAPSFSSNKNTILITNNTSSTTSGTYESCEEKEGKDTSEEYQTILEVTSTHEFVLAHLMANFLRENNNTISAFGNTTNCPLYLAKRSFLI
jgi:hypothetical protein